VEHVDLVQSDLNANSKGFHADVNLPYFDQDYLCGLREKPMALVLNQWNAASSWQAQSRSIYEMERYVS